VKAVISPIEKRNGEIKPKFKEKMLSEIQKAYTLSKTELLRGKPSYSRFLFSTDNPLDSCWLNDFLYKTISWVYACAQKTANSAVNAGYSIVPRKKDGKVKPQIEKFCEGLDEFFKNVNEEQVFEELLKQYHIDAAINGKAYFIFDFLENHPPFNTLIAIYRADFRTIKPVRMDQYLRNFPELNDPELERHKNTLIGWVQQIYDGTDMESFLEPMGKPQGKVKPLNAVPYVMGAGPNTRYFYPEQVLEVKLDAQGTSPLDCLIRSLKTEISAQEYTNSYFDNFTKAGIIMSLEEGSIGEAEVNKQWLKEEYGDPANAYSPMFLIGGIKLVRDSASTADVKYLEIREFNKLEVCGAMGTDPVLLSSTQGKSAEKEEAQRAFEEGTVTPRSVLFFRKLTKKIEEIYPKFKGKFEIIPGVKGRSSLHLLNIAQKMAMAGASTNEVRSLTGLQEIEGPVYDKPLMAVNVQPIQTIEDVARATMQPQKLVGNKAMKDNNPGGGQPRNENVQGGRSGVYNEQR